MAKQNVNVPAKAGIHLFPIKHIGIVDKQKSADIVMRMRKLSSIPLFQYHADTQAAWACYRT
jgi:hypothetical protein